MYCILFKLNVYQYMIVGCKLLEDDDEKNSEPLLDNDKRNLMIFVLCLILVLKDHIDVVEAM